jgi:putative membrane protein
MRTDSAVQRAFVSSAYPKWLLAAFVVWFAVWAINPWHPDDFILEHILTVVFLGVLVWSYRRFPLSNISYTTIFLFMCLHVVGAHYTYSEVPYKDWLAALGIGSPSEALAQDAAEKGRNHYDRMVHFSFGLLMAYPVRELFVRVARVRGIWAYYLPLDVVMSFSMIYELIEWAIAVFVGGDVGQSYLGTQGDEWDAHKDMALATLGGIITITITALVNYRYDRDFAKDFAESLYSAGGPLGEARLRELRESADPGRSPREG